MGYAWHGSCYENTDQALDAFARDIPSADAAGIISFTALPTVNGTGLVSWSISHQPFNGTAATTRTGTTQLQQCTFDSFRVDQVPDLLVIGLMVFAFFIGFRSGQTA